MFMEAFLMATFAVAFGLHSKMIVDRPFIARCDLAIDAADMSIIFNLTSGKQTPNDYPNGVEGMVQIKSFIPLDSATAIDARRRKIWEEARVKNHRLQPGPVGKNAAALIDFHMEGTDQVVTIPLNLYDMLLENTKCMSTGVYIEHPTSGEEMHLPLLPNMSIGFVNEFGMNGVFEIDHLNFVGLSICTYATTRRISSDCGRICRRRRSTSTSEAI